MNNEQYRQKVKRFLQQAAKRKNISLGDLEIAIGVNLISQTVFAEEQDLYDACKEFVLDHTV